MIKKLIVLCLLMIVSLWSHSQDTLKITREQLKITNIIFAEHSKFSQEVPLLKQQISNLELINDSWKKTDSLKQNQLQIQSNIINEQTIKIDKLKQSKRKILQGFGTINIFLIILILI